MSEETKTSEVLKGGEFLIKETDASSVFTPEDLNEEQKMMAETANDFIQKEILHLLDAIDKQQEGLNVRLMDKAGELGLLAT